jgi:hypothetical protein
VLSLSQVDVLEAQAHAADVVCEEGWIVPDQPWEGVAVAAILERAGVRPEARFFKVDAGNLTVLMPLEEARTAGALLARRLNVWFVSYHGFTSHFGDMPLWNIWCAFVVLPYVSIDGSRRHH